MLSIKREILDEIKAHFLSHPVEQGFLLGCTQDLEQADQCCLLPAEHAGMFCITPDAAETERLIHRWAEEKICFCGMVHSHLKADEELSRADRRFAEKLVQECQLPVLWFGVGAVQSGGVRFRFYAAESCGERVTLSEIKFLEER